MNEKLLDIVCCPVSHQDLRKADSGLLATVNAQILAGGIKNQRGNDVQEPLTAGLVTRDGSRLYPVHDGLVALLEAESIVLPD